MFLAQCCGVEESGLRQRRFECGFCLRTCCIRWHDFRAGAFRRADHAAFSVVDRNADQGIDQRRILGIIFYHICAGLRRDIDRKALSKGRGGGRDD